MVKNLKPKKSYQKRLKQLLLPALVASLVTNILLVFRVVPIDSVDVGCSSRKEIHLSLLSGGGDRMVQAKTSAARQKEKMILKNSRNGTDPNGNIIVEGASACDGVTYRLYIL